MVSKWAHQSNGADASPGESQGGRGQWRQADGGNEMKKTSECFHNKGRKPQLLPRDRTSAANQRLQASCHRPRIFNPIIPHQILSQPKLRHSRCAQCTCSTRFLQQQIIPESGSHQQPQPPNLIKSEAAEEAIVFMLDLTHVRVHAGVSFWRSLPRQRVKIKAGVAAEAPVASCPYVLIKSLLLLTVRWIFNRIALLCHFSFRAPQWNFVPPVLLMLFFSLFIFPGIYGCGVSTLKFYIFVDVPETREERGLLVFSLFLIICF